MVTPEMKAKYRAMAENIQPKKSMPDDAQVVVVACDQCKRVLQISRLTAEDRARVYRLTRSLETTMCYNCGSDANTALFRDELVRVQRSMLRRGYKWL